MMLLHLRIHQGELKKPLENKNKPIRTKGPTPNTKRTIFAVRGVVCCPLFDSSILEAVFFLDFLIDMYKIDLENHNSSDKLRVKPFWSK